jgi:fumarate reductase subunit C
MSARRPYVRSMSGWWRENPYFLRYMLREFTAVLVAAYAFILLAGLIRLAEGEAAYAQWLQALERPWAAVFHVAVLAVFVYHTWSWFEIMPKTLPAVVLGGRRLPDRFITGAGLAAALICCFLVLGTALWLAR